MHFVKDALRQESVFLVGYPSSKSSYSISACTFSQAQAVCPLPAHYSAPGYSSRHRSVSPNQPLASHSTRNPSHSNWILFNLNAHLARTPPPPPFAES